MTRHALVLRPEPGAAATVRLLQDAGVAAIALPLFEIRPLDWTLPPVVEFDALLLTSANTIRHGGLGLTMLHTLPVVAVGKATAAAATEAGFTVAVTGQQDAAAVVADARRAGIGRLLRLGGRDRILLADVTDIAVYASEEAAPPPGALAIATDAVVLLHSPRAAKAFGYYAERDCVDRNRVHIAALSEAVAAAAGDGWASIDVADVPTNHALVALAAARAIDP